MKDQCKIKKFKKIRRHKRVRAKVKGTGVRPRLSVFRSLGHIYAQLIDDEKNKTLASASDLKIKDKKGKTKTDLAREVGIFIANEAQKKKIEEVVFDKGGFKYHGRVRALADAARKEGLKF